jgi:hypothetical protein
MKGKEYTKEELEHCYAGSTGTSTTPWWTPSPCSPGTFREERQRRSSKYIGGKARHY